MSSLPLRARRAVLSAILAALLAAIVTTPTVDAAECTVHVNSIGPAPDNSPACTPGDYRPLTRTQVCAAKERPTLTAGDRRTILAKYGVPDWTGADGELDHRIPLFLGGLTNPRDVWPQPGPLPNPKDRLELYVRHRVCDARTMRVSTARRIFLGNWRLAYRHYHLAAASGRR